MDTTSSKHVKVTLNALLEGDIVGSKSLVTFHQWIECVCGISRATLEGWETAIRQQKWFEDDVIQEGLIDYCRALDESERYDPFTKILNRIVELGRHHIPGIPAKKSYPVNDLCFVRHDKNNVQTVPEHGIYGAMRRPDIICVRRPVAESLSSATSSHRAQWTDIMHWCELKYNDRLISDLSKKRKDLNMAPLRSNGLPISLRRVSISYVDGVDC